MKELGRPFAASLEVRVQICRKGGQLGGRHLRPAQTIAATINHKKNTPLFEWVDGIADFWKNHFETKFTVKPYKGMYVSEALDVLHALLKPIAPRVGRETLAYAMEETIRRKSAKGKN